MSKTYRKLYSYDINALYPTVMAQQLMPIGFPIIFEGNIRMFEPNAYGFFFCKITSPAFLEHPIMQRRIKTSDGIRTIAGLGTWIGWIFSEEMFNAMKFGYTFEIFKGYTFDKGNLFGGYVNKMFNLRQQFPKGHPMNDNAKLLNNSLYGKFGMKDEITRIEILNNVTDQDKLNISQILELHKSDILDLIEIDNYIMIIFKDITNLEYNDKLDLFHGTEVNVAIASAITAYARILMSQFKNNNDFKLFYTDTDSIVTNKPLPDSMVGNALGQVKLEHVISKAVFLAN
jgi:hypothetical protein